MFLLAVQNLAFSVFVGIAVYGIILYYGGELKERIPAGLSLFLGFTAVISVVVIVLVGGLIDKEAIVDEEKD